MNDVSFTLGEVILRATVTGTGPTVLLLHAGGEDRHVWAPIAAAMAKSGLRTVAVDLRGHGDSTGRATTLRAVVDDVLEIVSRETPPIVMVGSSLGGLTAFGALAEPSTARRVAGLVLVDVVPDLDPGRVRSWLEDLGLRDKHAELVEDILGTGPEILPAAATLDLPILLVRAERSPLSDADVDRLRTANRRVTIARVPGAGHLVARDAPAELARIVSFHADAWFATNNVVRHASELQRTLGAEEIDHHGGTLYAHLRRTHALTVEWNAAGCTQLAALCHASYGTDGFQLALLPTTDRSRLQHVIGHDAEALVYLYGACDRSSTYRNLGHRPLPVTDRFTGTSRTIHGAELRGFAVLTIANELDVARHAQLPTSTLTEIRSLITGLASYAPREAERALADEALA